ncbi:carbohydrate sulfotransferase 1-like [Parasteatoda tepidariorum]|uniref:carbohydrate sulfotransferase 1-like n=1 Tax=Parasteatoda tepidariorum TaxID=114398 RepID=UPI00077F86C5|nr:carbohydrate sulfotransferase 1-like [Parasteatoda tepidariorum]
MSLDLRRHITHNVLGQHHRWRRYFPCVLFALIIAFLQFYALVGNTYFIKNTLQTLSNLRHPKENNDLHVLLISYARTGSSFVGDLLQSLPNSFYYFEPLHFLSSPVFNSSHEEARELLNRLYNCNVTSVHDFMKWQKSHSNYMKLKRSFRYWKECTKLRSCYNGTFLDSLCRNQKLIIAKTIRIKLKEAAELFATHPHLNLKIIYLSRDPRGTLNSRTKFPISSWCKHDPMCSNHKVFCSALNEDLQTACVLLNERPNDFMVIRYEDLCLNPLAISNRMTQFLGFSDIPGEMEEFLQTHTVFIGNIKEKSRKQGLDVPYSTFRNSSITATSWRQQMKFEKMIEIQDNCKNALKGLGYYSYSTPGSVRSNINFDSDLDNAMESFCSMNH